MLFSSPVFIFLFLPIVVGIYLLLPSRLKNLFLVMTSLLFYAWGEKAIIIVLIVSTVADYLCALIIEKGYRKTGMALSLLTNLSLLGFFKYFNFAFENYKALLDLLGFSHPGLMNVPYVALPIGISFYTFQTLSYTIDVYRGNIKANHNLIDYSAFVTMFPQLVAGPIVRYSDIHHQLRNKDISIQNFSLGLQRFIIGLAKKMIVANTFAEIADKTFSYAPSELSSALLWFGVLAYAIQLYYDFSGYSDMAIGMGHMLGFTFPENFNYPYISKSIREMWQRWHITLSTWFKDYLYISLGGSRVSLPRVYVNLIIVFIITGLWHGAAWNFVIWGLANGAFIIIEKAGFAKVLKKLGAPFQHFYTIMTWLITLVIFRSPDMGYAIDYYAQMFAFSKGNIPSVTYFSYFYLNTQTLIMLVIGITFCLPVYTLIEQKLNMIMNLNNTTHVMLSIFKIAFFVLILFVSASFLAADVYNPFIYFRF